MRVGQIGDDKSRLEIDSSGNLKIINRQSTTDTTVIELDANGDAEFSGKITADEGSVGGFNIGANDIFGGNAAIDNAATTIVLGNLDGTSKIALGASADSITMDANKGFFADGGGNVLIGDAGGKKISYDGSNIEISS